MILSVLLGLQLSAYAVTVKVDGSSTVFPITEAVSEEFQKEKKGAVNVTVGISGTGGGFKKFCRGETDVQDASRPIMKEEMEACRKANVKYFELPIGFDALTIVVSQKNKWLKSISVADLKKIWEPEAKDKVTKWNQVRSEWPDVSLKNKLYGAGSDSGTFDYFTEAIVGKAKAQRSDYTGSEDDNTIVTGVANDEHAMGYIPYSYYEANKTKLRALPIDGGPKAPKKGEVSPTAQTVENGTYYPLSRPIFIYVNAASADKPEVKEFTEFYLKHGNELVKQVKYVPLPNKAYETALQHFKNKKLGTAFKGEAQVGITIEELLKRESSL